MNTNPRIKPILVARVPDERSECVHVITGEHADRGGGGDFVHARADQGFRAHPQLILVGKMVRPSVVGQYVSELCFEQTIHRFPQAAFNNVRFEYRAGTVKKRSTVRTSHSKKCQRIQPESVASRYPEPGSVIKHCGLLGSSSSFLRMRLMYTCSMCSEGR